MRPVGEGAADPGEGRVMDHCAARMPDAPHDPSLRHPVLIRHPDQRGGTPDLFPCSALYFLSPCKREDKGEGHFTAPRRDSGFRAP